MNTSFRPGPALPADNLKSDTVNVSITKPPEIGLADWMSHLRDWLNQHGIEPAAFKYHDASGNPTYEVGFPDRNGADLFAAEFTKSTFDNKPQPRTTGRDPS